MHTLHILAGVLAGISVTILLAYSVLFIVECIKSEVNLKPNDNEDDDNDDNIRF